MTKAILVAQFLQARAWWQLADEASAGPRDLLTELVRAANRNPKAAPIGIPRQVTAPGVPAPAR